MTTVELKLNLPDRIAQEAQRAGLLTEPAPSRLIEEAVRRKAGKKSLDAMQHLRAANVLPLTEKDLAAESQGRARRP